MLTQLRYLTEGSFANRIDYVETNPYFRIRENLLTFLTGLHDGWGIPVNILELFLLKHVIVLDLQVDLDALRVTTENFEESRFLAWYMCAHHVPPSKLAAPYLAEMRHLALRMLEEGRLAPMYCAGMRPRSTQPVDAVWLLHDRLTYNLFERISRSQDLATINPRAAYALRELPAVHDRVFTQQWLPQLLPKVEHMRVKDMSLALLKELYQGIYKDGAEQLYKKRTRATGPLSDERSI